MKKGFLFCFFILACAHIEKSVSQEVIGLTIEAPGSFPQKSFRAFLFYNIFHLSSGKFVIGECKETVLKVEIVEWKLKMEEETYILTAVAFLEKEGKIEEVIKVKEEGKKEKIIEAAAQQIAKRIIRRLK